jgi:hypothetical protein
MTTRSLFTTSVLGLNANSIVLAPFPAQVGNDVDVSVRLFNSDRLPAKKVLVQVFVDDEKLGEKTMDVGELRTETAGGFKAWKAKPGRHDVRATVAWGTRNGTAAKPIDINPPHAVGAGGVASLMGRATLFAPSRAMGATLSLGRLAIASTDVRLNPAAPGAGTPVDLSVRIQNPGTADAKGVQAEIFADGVRLGGASGDVPAGRDFVFSGFPRWTPTSGKHVLLCRATFGGQTTEATREVVVGAAMALVKPVLTTSQPMTLATPSVGGAMMMHMAVARPDLQIQSTDITFSPASPKGGDPLTMTIVVRNVGNADANGGIVLGVFQVDGAEAGRREFPVTVPAGGMTTLIWPVSTPSGRTLTTTATATVGNDSRADNNQATASIAIASVMRYERPQVLILPGTK